MLTNAGSSDAFVMKLDGAGNYKWAKLFGDASFQRGTGVAVDSANSVLLTGTFGGKIDFGGGPLTCAGSGDVFVAKLDSGGAQVWSKSFGDDNDQQATSVAADGAGNVVTTGYFWGSVDFGGGKLTSAAGQEVFVAKLDGASGGHLWSKGFGNGGQTGASVTTDAVGNVVLTGAMLGQMDFGGGPIASAGGRDAFVAKLDGGDAGYAWGKRYGDAAQDQYGQAIATDSAENVLVAGYFAGSMNFGAGGQLMSAGSSDVFVAKLSP